MFERRVVFVKVTQRSVTRRKVELELELGEDLELVLEDFVFGRGGGEEKSSSSSSSSSSPDKRSSTTFGFDVVFVVVVVEVLVL